MQFGNSHKTATELEEHLAKYPNTLDNNQVEQHARQLLTCLAQMPGLTVYDTCLVLQAAGKLHDRAMEQQIGRWLNSTEFAVFHADCITTIPTIKQETAAFAARHMEAKSADE